MSKPYSFRPLLATVANVPPEYCWVVQLRFGGAFSPVNTFPLVYCTDYETAFECLAAWQPNTKKRLAYVKQLGIRHIHTRYDEQFAAALRMQADISADEYYEEKTAEDKRVVQLHQKKGIVRAIWRGAVIRDDGKQPSADSVLDRDEEMGLG